VHIIELLIAVVEVDTKVTYISLTQNQCLQCVTRLTPPLGPERMLKYRDRATPQNWTMTAWTSWATSTTKLNRIYQFFGEKFYQRRLQFLVAYSF